MTSGVGPGKLWTLRFLPSAVNHCDLFSTSAFLSILTDKYSFWQYDIDYPSQMSSVLLRKWSPSQPLFSLVSMGERPLRDGTWQRLRLVTEGQTNKLDTEKIFGRHDGTSDQTERRFLWSERVGSGSYSEIVFHFLGRDQQLSANVDV